MIFKALLQQYFFKKSDLLPILLEIQSFCCFLIGPQGGPQNSEISASNKSRTLDLCEGRTQKSATLDPLNPRLQNLSWSANFKVSKNHVFSQDFGTPQIVDGDPLAEISVTKFSEIFPKNNFEKKNDVKDGLEWFLKRFYSTIFSKNQIC